MKITTRIVSGYGLLIFILAALAIYQSVTVGHLQRINKTLAEVNFQYARNSLDARNNLYEVEFYTRKVFVSDDTGYRKQLKEVQKDFEESLMKLKHTANLGEDLEDIRQLSELWNSYVADMGQLYQRDAGLLQKLQEELDQMRTCTISIFDKSVSSMQRKLDKSTQTLKTAELVLMSATLLALAISILVSFLIVRSISKPLGHLTEGTRAIAEGKFFYRLDTSRNDEFSELARDFNTMTLRLNELDKLKKDFVSHVSHELKSPLASMQETLQLMLDQIPGPLNEKQRRLLELNRQSGRRLTSMIGNLLDLARTEAGVMEYELKSLDLAPLVRTAIDELEVQAHEKQVQIESALTEEPLPVICDGDRIVQVLVNLIGNAIKFTPKAGIVRVQVEAVQNYPEKMPELWRRLIGDAGKDGYFGLVTISDSGPGIPDSDKERIFEKFHQVKQGSKLPGQGAGLGLAISRTIVQAHRGAIWADDNPGGGSRFFLLLRPGTPGEKAVMGASTPI